MRLDGPGPAGAHIMQPKTPFVKPQEATPGQLLPTWLSKKILDAVRSKRYSLCSARRSIRTACPECAKGSDPAPVG